MRAVAKSTNTSSPPIAALLVDSSHFVPRFSLLFILFLLAILSHQQLQLFHCEPITITNNLYSVSHYPTQQSCLNAEDSALGVSDRDEIPRHRVYYLLDACITWNYDDASSVKANSQYNRCSGNRVQNLLFTNADCSNAPLGSREFKISPPQDECQKENHLAVECGVFLKRQPYTLPSSHSPANDVRISHFTYDQSDNSDQKCSSLTVFEYLPAEICHFVSKQVGYVKLKCHSKHLLYQYYLDSECKYQAALNHTFTLNECLPKEEGLRGMPMKVECNESSSRGIIRPWIIVCLAFWMLTLVGI